MPGGAFLLGRKALCRCSFRLFGDRMLKFIEKQVICLAITVFLQVFSVSMPLFSADCPREILHLPPGESAILVDKSAQRLFLFKATGEKGTITSREFICATGKISGDKQCAGDRRTPDGVYFCRDLLLPPLLGKRFGPCAVPLNYPNFMDRRRGRDGNGIWLHGINESRPVESTQGCVVLRNRDLVDLANRMRLYLSPVVIVEKPEKKPEEFRAKVEKAALAFLKRWKNAWAGGDITAYISCYDPSFLSKGMDLLQWRAYKNRLFEKYHHTMSIQLGDPVIVCGKDYLVFAFRQYFQGGQFSATGLKWLYVRRAGKTFKIMGEAWFSEDKLQKAWHQYAQALSKVVVPSDNFHILVISPEKTRKVARQDPYEETKRFLAKWKTSWEAKDINRYASLYSKRFKHAYMGLEDWKAYKFNTFRENGPIHLMMKKVRITVSGEMASVYFMQVYHSEKVTDVGKKEMILCREEGTWKILREHWQRCRQ